MGQCVSRTLLRFARSDCLIPEHGLFFGTHIGPFMGAYMAMGMAQMFVTYQEDKPFVHAVMESRLAWALAIFQHAVALGAEVIIWLIAQAERLKAIQLGRALGNAQSMTVPSAAAVASCVPSGEKATPLTGSW